MQAKSLLKLLSFLIFLFFITCRSSNVGIKKDPFYLYRLGVLNFREGHLEEAEKQLKESIALDPKNSAALNALGLTYLSMGKFQEAIIYFNKAITVSPAYSDVYNNLGVTYLQMEDFQKAEEYFNKAKNDTVYNLMPNVWYNLGLLREKQKKYEEAIYYFSEAIKRKENYPIAYLHRGICYFNIDKKEEALNDLKKYNEFVKDDPEGLYHMGKCLIALKQEKEGKEALEKAYLLGPETEPGKMAKKLLDLIP